MPTSYLKGLLVGSNMLCRNQCINNMRSCYFPEARAVTPLGRPKKDSSIKTKSPEISWMCCASKDPLNLIMKRRRPDLQVFREPQLLAVFLKQLARYRSSPGAAGTQPRFKQPE